MSVATSVLAAGSLGLTIPGEGWLWKLSESDWSQYSGEGSDSADGVHDSMLAVDS